MERRYELFRMMNIDWDRKIVVIFEKSLANIYSFF